MNEKNNDEAVRFEENGCKLTAETLTQTMVGTFMNADEFTEALQTVHSHLSELFIASNGTDAEGCPVSSNEVNDDLYFLRLMVEGLRKMQKDGGAVCVMPDVMNARIRMEADKMRKAERDEIAESLRESARRLKDLADQEQARIMKSECA